MEKIGFSKKRKGGFIKNKNRIKGNLKLKFLSTHILYEFIYPTYDHMGIHFDENQR